ncbi:hypothetical protein EJ063_03435 [Vibrio aquaticus]|uniref:Uncharacterized protein n=1 Tax=Vibrio aquaticus TaxID=2496559 RepID=A0A432D1P1_9VIBR|nr:hypothetical protein [Vibrio aquaticus]RTZ17851.1 hypothetical protein EJ063_03435 [Vibrio aquaticus]
MKAQMSMLEKEWLEHTMVTRVPLVLLICGLVMLFSIVMNSTIQTNITYELTYSDGFESRFELGKQVSNVVFLFAGLISMLLTGLYFPKTLRKERQEGSLMFWRSMPVSDMTIHGVKLAFGLLAIPVICSMLVVSADLLMWVMNASLGGNFPLFETGESFFYIFTHWFEFIGRMWLVGLALAPLAMVSLAISQKVNSPLLVMTVALFVAQLLSSTVLGTSLVGDFINDVFRIPFEVLTMENPLVGFANAGAMNVLVYALIGAAGLLVSLRLAKFAD